ncbi:hypothetical protein D9613_006730 [Agrocybe pediades]|uniref:F-box domain-containing protein n=1 Tax=Agrocybe pediades TaxID=84607 RepID=A0A8H4VK74_9AGAR|nr:hypothetical protein D9613_006730 [Agrocybe pediades]
MSTATDAVRTIDSEIEQHEQEILALKTRRNTYAPISRLPPELLSRIFECYKTVQFIPTQFQYSHPLRWIRCTHVCRLWRTVALDSPLLWAELHLKYLAWAKESLIRSKMAPLKVSIHLRGLPEDNPTIELAKDIIRQGSRLKDVIIKAASRARDSIEDVLRSLPRSTPNLQSLEITHVSRSTQNVCLLPRDCICEAEKLQRLRITGCAIDWVQHLSNKRALTVLRLDKVTSTISMPQFLRCLAEMRSLQLLELKNAFPTPVPHHTSVQSRRIPLPSLRLLRLWECPPETLGSFFKHMALNNKVVMDIKSEGADESRFTTFLEEMSSALSLRGPDSPIRSLRITTGTLLQLSMIGYSYDSPEVDEETTALAEARDRIPIFLLQLSFSSLSSTNPSALWINACATLPFSCVRSVYWNSLPLISAETVAFSFGTLQNLDSLTFCRGHTDFDVDDILLTTLPSPEGTCPKFAFPKLRSLTLNDFILYGDTLTKLIGLLIQRYEGGSEVETLVIQLCYGVEGKEIGLLREVVTDVAWDGIVLRLSSDSELTESGSDSDFD